MYVARNAVRQPLQLRACLEIAGESGPGRRIPARTLDLSSHGVGLIAIQPLPAGQIVTIMIEDGEFDPGEERSPKRRRRWRGHVVYSYNAPGKAGRRLGICFEEPEFGPQVTMEIPTSTRGNRRIRYDGPCSMESGTREQVDLAPAPVGKAAAGSRPFRSAALLGLGLDQILKAMLVPAASVVPGRHLAIADDWPSLAITLAGLGSAGLLARLAERAPHGERPGVSCGMGLILGALLSGLVDRLAFGEVRAIGPASLTPAHLLAATGAAMAMGSLLITSGTRKGAVSGKTAVGHPADPGCTGVGC